MPASHGKAMLIKSQPAINLNVGPEKQMQWEIASGLTKPKWKVSGLTNSELDFFVGIGRWALSLLLNQHEKKDREGVGLGREKMCKKKKDFLTVPQIIVFSKYIVKCSDYSLLWGKKSNSGNICSTVCSQFPKLCQKNPNGEKQQKKNKLLFFMFNKMFWLSIRNYLSSLEILLRLKMKLLRFTDWKKKAFLNLKLTFSLRTVKSKKDYHVPRFIRSSYHQKSIPFPFPLRLWLSISCHLLLFNCAAIHPH